MQSKNDAREEDNKEDKEDKDVTIDISNEPSTSKKGSKWKEKTQNTKNLQPAKIKGYHNRFEDLDQNEEYEVDESMEKVTAEHSIHSSQEDSEEDEEEKTKTHEETKQNNWRNSIQNSGKKKC